MNNYKQESCDYINHNPEKTEELRLKMVEFEKILTENPQGWLK